MKHLRTVSASPAMALLPPGHPGIVESIFGFLRAPVEVLGIHLKKGENPA